MPQPQVISKQRVVDHGEVLTPPALVKDMLDLPGVADECERIDASFLEPACGDGNFLVEILRRRLEKVNQHPKRAIIRWECDALLGLANLYGIELLFDNVQACRDRLHDIFQDAYTARFGAKAKPAVLAAARHIVRSNIHLGDALAMTTVGDKVLAARPLVFTQWSMLAGGRFKRWQFEYEDLMPADPKSRDTSALFKPEAPTIPTDHGKPYFKIRSVGSLPLVHYLKLAETSEPGET